MTVNTLLMRIQVLKGAYLQVSSIPLSCKLINSIAIWIRS